MRYLVVGNTAVLASRGIERFDTSKMTAIPVSVVGVPDGTSLNVIGSTSNKSYRITSETTEIPLADIQQKGSYAVVVLWKENEEQRTAYGNSFTVSEDDFGNFIIPTPCTAATDLESMWKGLTQALEILLPLVDEIKNGNDVI